MPYNYATETVNDILVDMAARLTVLEGAATPATAPVLTQTSATGENPMTWDTEYTDLIPDADDYVVLRHRVDAGAWVTETPVLVTSAWVADYIVDGNPHPWPLYDGATFVADEVIDVQGGVIRGEDDPVWSNTLSDTMAGAPATAPWTPGTPPAGQNLAFGSSTATFSSLDFGTGEGIIMVSSKERRVTGVAIDGNAAALVRESGTAASGFHVSMWRGAVSGSQNVVVTGADTFGQIAMSHGTLVTSDATPTTTSSAGHGYNPDPQTTGSITCPTDGIIIGAFGTEAGASDPTWTAGTEEADVSAGSSCRHTSGSRDTTGALTLTGWNFAGSAWVAAAWGP